MRTALLLPAALAGALLAGCRGEEAARPPVIADSVGGGTLAPRGPLREVLRLENEPGGELVLTGVAPTPESRAALVAEVRRRWPGRTLRDEVTVEAGAPGGWVSEAIALLPYVATIEDGGLIVKAEEGAAGGGTLTLTGRVPDEAALARLAEDAAASIAPPFVVLTPLFVGLAADTSAVAPDSLAVAAPTVTAGPGAETAADALRTALGTAPLLFDEGSATLTPAARAALDGAARALAPYDDIEVQVGAPGGTSGSASLDRALAVRRATALRGALLSLGLDTARVALDPDNVPGVSFRLLRESRGVDE